VGVPKTPTGFLWVRTWVSEPCGTGDIYRVIMGEPHLLLASSAFRRSMDHLGKSLRRALVNQ